MRFLIKKLPTTTLSVYLSSLICLILGALSSVFVTRALSVPERGKLALVLSVSGIITYPLSLGLPSSLNYVGISKARQNRKALLLAAVAICSTLTVVTFTFGHFWLNYFRFSWGQFWFLICALAVSQILQELARSYLMTLQNFTVYSYFTTAMRALPLFSVLALFFCGKLSIESIIIGNIFSGFLLFAIFSLQEKAAVGVQKIKAEACNIEVYRVGLFSMAASTITILLKRVDLFSIEKHLGDTELGRYSVALFIISLCETIVGTAGSLIATKSAARMLDLGYCLKLSCILILVVNFGFIVFKFTGATFINLLYGNRYSDIVPVVSAFLPYCISLVPVSIVANAIAGRGFGKRYLISHLIALPSSYLLHEVFIVKFGIKGAAYAQTCINIFLLGFLLPNFFSLIRESAKN